MGIRRKKSVVSDTKAGLRWAYLTLVVGLSASITANILSAGQGVVAKGVAAAYPVALFLVIEMQSKVPSQGDWMAKIRTLSVVVVGAAAAFASSVHMVEVGLEAGQPLYIALLLPVVIDGSMLPATISIADCKRQSAKAGPVTPIRPKPKPKPEPAPQPVRPAAATRVLASVPDTPRAGSEALPSSGHIVRDDSTRGTSTVASAKSSKTEGARLKAAEARRLQAQGLLNQEIAERLGVSTRSVGRYLQKGVAA